MRVLLLLLLTAPALLAGCSGQKKLLAEQRRTIDSLYVVERTLRTDLYALQDSIVFYDEIDSGLYFRKQRVLEDRINRLEFLLAAHTDTLCLAEPVATLLADELFKPASADLTEDGLARLAALVEEIHEAYAGRAFRVEGHSDDVPLGTKLRERYPTNWELSAARATTVVRHFVEELGMEAVRFEGVALGATRPVASNATAEGRRLNRRITIRVLPP